jgi:Transglycosylase SLT domain
LKTARGILSLLAGVCAAMTGSAGLGAELGASPLDRIAYAVDGAESSHGGDPRMWRAELDGPQGPMQVSAAAATDIGAGDRFDPQQNRMLGRAYLAHMYRRYGSWPDAVAAYNWGPNRVDTWIEAGRPFDKLPTTVANYRSRVLLASGLAGAVVGPPGRRGTRIAQLGIVHPQPRRNLATRRSPGNRPDEVELLYVAIMRATEPLNRAEARREVSSRAGGAAGSNRR